MGAVDLMVEQGEADSFQDGTLSGTVFAADGVGAVGEWNRRIPIALHVLEIDAGDEHVYALPSSSARRLDTCSRMVWGEVFSSAIHLISIMRSAQSRASER